MNRDYVVEKIITQKKQLGWTIDKLAKESGVGIRTINRILAKQDVRFSSMDAVLSVLNLDITLDTKLSA